MVAEGPLTAAEIYEQINGGGGVQSLAEAHTSADYLTRKMVERAQRISALRRKTMSGWQGGASDSAADATLPLVQAAADDAVHLQNAQDAVGAQMGAFGTAKNSVKPVAAQPPEITSEDLVNVLVGKGLEPYNAKVARWQADAQANIDAFGAYHSASTANGGQMPSQYARLADSGAPISLAETTGSTTGGDDTRGRAGASDTDEWARRPQQPVVPARDDQGGRRSPGGTTPGGTTPGGTTPGGTTPWGTTPGSTTPGGTTPGGTVPGGTTPGGSDATHANSYVPRPVVPPAAGGGYEFGPTGQPVGNLGGNGNTGFGPGTGGYPPYGPGGPGGITSGPGGNTGGPGNPGGYRTGTPGGNTGNPGNPGNRTGSPGTPGGYRPTEPGVGSGARLPEERGPGRGTPGSAGARGANGVPVGTAPGGRGKGEDDREKKAAPYLRNPDPDETFGGFTEKPVPPVIGENRSPR